MEANQLAVGSRVMHWGNDKGVISSMKSSRIDGFVEVMFDNNPLLTYDCKLSELRLLVRKQ